jgi:hypothetical protein
MEKLPQAQLGQQLCIKDAATSSWGNRNSQARRRVQCWAARWNSTPTVGLGCCEACYGILQLVVSSPLKIFQSHLIYLDTSSMLQIASTNQHALQDHHISSCWDLAGDFNIKFVRNHQIHPGLNKTPTTRPAHLGQNEPGSPWDVVQCPKCIHIHSPTLQL